MGRPDGSNDRRTALCLRRRYDTASSAMALGRYEHGECSCFYDYGTCYQDYEPGSFKNRYRLEKVRFVYPFRDDVFFPVRDGCESGCVIQYKNN